MVQYKAMEHKAAGAGFRVPDKQLAKEIGRMEEVLNEIRKCCTIIPSFLSFAHESSPLLTTSVLSLGCIYLWIIGSFWKALPTSRVRDKDRE